MRKNAPALTPYILYYIILYLIILYSIASHTLAMRTHSECIFIQFFTKKRGKKQPKMGFAILGGIFRSQSIFGAALIIYRKR